MKYIVYNKETIEIADIVSTILEDRPMIMPFTIFCKEEDYENCKTEDMNKAHRALNIFIREYGKRGWCIKEIAGDLHDSTRTY